MEAQSEPQKTRIRVETIDLAQMKFEGPPEVRAAVEKARDIMSGKLEPENEPVKPESAMEYLKLVFPDVDFSQFSYPDPDAAADSASASPVLPVPVPAPDSPEGAGGETTGADADGRTDGSTDGSTDSSTTAPPIPPVPGTDPAPDAPATDGAGAEEAKNPAEETEKTPDTETKKTEIEGLRELQNRAEALFSTWEEQHLGAFPSRYHAFADRFEHHLRKETAKDRRKFRVNRENFDIYISDCRDKVIGTLRKQIGLTNPANPDETYPGEIHTLKEDEIPRRIEGYNKILDVFEQRNKEILALPAGRNDVSSQQTLFLSSQGIIGTAITDVYKCAEKYEITLPERTPLKTEADVGVKDKNKCREQVDDARGSFLRSWSRSLFYTATMATAAATWVGGIWADFTGQIGRVSVTTPVSEWLNLPIQDMLWTGPSQAIGLGCLIAGGLAAAVRSWSIKGGTEASRKIRKQASFSSATFGALGGGALAAGLVSAPGSLSLGLIVGGGAALAYGLSRGSKLIMNLWTRKPLKD